MIYVVSFPENKNLFQLRMILNSFFPQKKIKGEKKRKKKKERKRKKERILIDQKIVKKEEIGLLAKAAIALDDEIERDRYTE